MKVKLAVRRHIPKDLAGYARIVMKRDGIEDVKKISRKEFKEVLVDADCLREEKRIGADLPVYSRKTRNNKEKLERMYKLNGTKCYIAYSKDMSVQERARSRKNALRAMRSVSKKEA